MKVLVLSSSMTGHVHRLAGAVADGASGAGDAAVDLRRVPETLPGEVLEKTGALRAQEAFSDVPILERNKLAGARFQGRYVALVAPALAPHRDAIIASLPR